MLSFRTRLILVHLGVIMGVLTCTAVGAYWLLSRAVYNQLDAALLALAETEEAMLEQDDGRPIRIHEVPPGPAPPSFVRLDRLVQIVDAEGRVLARSANLGAARLPTPPALLARLAAGETVFETLASFGEEPVRMVSVPAHRPGSRQGIQVAGSLDDAKRAMESASLLFMAMTLALLAAVGTAGAALTRRAFRAIDQIVQQARRIGEANLCERLPHPGTRDEIGRLVDTLNEMLSRLERSFEVQRRFTADASHELRSPLSRLRTDLEVTLRRRRDAVDYEETLRSCLEEVERLTLLVEELLLLARLDANRAIDPAETVSLNRLLEDAIDQIRPIAVERQLRLTITPSPPVTAHVAGSAVALVLSNLLDNAVKFSPPGGCITASLTVDGREALMGIADSGPGISTDELPRLFERFYRGSVARATEAAGVGLGLALCHAIAENLGGRIEAANRPEGGAAFSFRLPLHGPC